MAYNVKYQRYNNVDAALDDMAGEIGQIGAEALRGCEYAYEVVQSFNYMRDNPDDLVAEALYVVAYENYRAYKERAVVH